MNLINEFEYLVSHFDGNANDLDDIVALPVVALLTFAVDKQDQSTFFYNNDLGRISKADKIESMRESAQFAETLGIDTYDYQENTQLATEKLVEILNSGKKVLSFEGGRMETMYRALEQVDPQNLANITLLSHSRWNEEQAVITASGITTVRTWADIRRDFPSVKVIQIRDQNGGFFSTDWTWLDQTSNPVFQATREAMKNALRPNSPHSQLKINDASDAGMFFYAATGNERGTPLDAKVFLEQAINPQTVLPSPNNNNSGSPQEPEPSTEEVTVNNQGPVITTEESGQAGNESLVYVPGDFSLTGFRSEANGAALTGQLLGFRGGARNETGTASFNFSGNPGSYNIVLGTFDESDGQARFQLNRNNSNIGQITLDQNINGSNKATAKSKVERIIASEVSVSNGDLFTLRGFEVDGEHARFDFIRFEQSQAGQTTPPPPTESSSNTEGNSNPPPESSSSSNSNSEEPTVSNTPQPEVTETPVQPDNTRPIRWELEAADTLIGYRKENIGSASGQKIISLKGRQANEQGSASFTFSEAAGAYDITIGAYDENDGEGRFQLELTDFETKSKSIIGALELNQQLGSNLGNKQTFITSTIASGIQLTAGDILTLRGFEHGSEHARADYLELS